MLTPEQMQEMRAKIEELRTKVEEVGGDYNNPVVRMSAYLEAYTDEIVRNAGGSVMIALEVVSQAVAMSLAKSLAVERERQNQGSIAGVGAVVKVPIDPRLN